MSPHGGLAPLSQLAQAELGLETYVARYYDPQTGHFTQADSIIPEPGKASAFDRYAYVLNNPIRYSDPSGHGIDSGIGDSGYDRSGDLKRWREYTLRKNKTEKQKRIEDDNSFHFDTKEIANKILPIYTPEQLREAATNLDKIALGFDMIAESIVVTYVGIGFFGISFEGTTVLGIAGAGAGWILGQTNPIVRTLVGIGNVSASFASGFSILGDLKTGDTRLVSELSFYENKARIKNDVTVSSNSEISFSTGIIGLGTSITEASTALQIGAVANDLGYIPTWQHTFTQTMDFYFR